LTPEVGYGDIYYKMTINLGVVGWREQYVKQMIQYTRITL